MIEADLEFILAKLSCIDPAQLQSLGFASQEVKSSIAGR